MDAFVAPSPKSAHYLQALMPSVPVSVISNGVDTTRIASLIPSAEQKAALRAQLGLGTDDFILIFVGRIGMEKRVFELVDAVAAAAAREPRIRMIFIGDGPTLDPLKRRAQDSAAPAAFVFTGFLGWEAVIAHLASSNLFVTVSLSEVQPMTIIEAQLCGLPVVARRDESYFEMILDGKNGYLVEEDSEVVEKILELARDGRKWADFSRESLRRSQNLSIENTVSRMEELYGTLIGSRGVRHAVPKVDPAFPQSSDRRPAWAGTAHQRGGGAASAYGVARPRPASRSARSTSTPTRSGGEPRRPATELMFTMRGEPSAPPSAERRRSGKNACVTVITLRRFTSICFRRSSPVSSSRGPGTAIPALFTGPRACRRSAHPVLWQPPFPRQRRPSRQRGAA